MSTKKILLVTMMVVLAIVVFVAWTAWNGGHLGWAHIIGLGATVVLLVLISIWPGSQQPTRPPP